MDPNGSLELFDDVMKPDVTDIVMDRVRVNL